MESQNESKLLKILILIFLHSSVVVDGNYIGSENFINILK